MRGNSLDSVFYSGSSGGLLCIFWVLTWGYISVVLTTMMSFSFLDRFRAQSRSLHEPLRCFVGHVYAHIAGIFAGRRALVAGGLWHGGETFVEGFII